MAHLAQGARIETVGFRRHIVEAIRGRSGHAQRRSARQLGAEVNSAEPNRDQISQGDR